MGRFILILAILLLLGSAVFSLLERLGLPPLPGDVIIRRKYFTIYIPVTTSIIVIIAVTVLFQWL